MLEAKARYRQNSQDQIAMPKGTQSVPIDSVQTIETVVVHLHHALAWLANRPPHHSRQLHTNPKPKTQNMYLQRPVLMEQKIIRIQKDKGDIIC